MKLIILILIIIFVMFKIKCIFIFILIIFLYFLIRYIDIPIIDESTFFTTWATSVYEISPPHFKLKNNSIRQIVKISASGEKLRIKFSNKNGKSNLEIKRVSIADLVHESEIRKNSLKIITFNRKESIRIKKGEEIYSDTISYSLKPLSNVAISIYFGSVPSKLSGHPLSLTYSYFEKGNKILNKVFSESNKVSHWYFISAVEVSDKNPKKTIVCFGDSITDGVSKAKDARNNYPNILFKNLYENEKVLDYSVINEGINGDKLTINGIRRYKNDALDIKGVSHIIVLIGVNDIKNLNSKADKIISVYKEMIKESHKRNISIYAGTIMPFGLYKNTWNKNREKERQNVNKWIRETKPKNGGFDFFFDFDKILKDPNKEMNLKKSFDCGDGLHPNFEGYKKISEIIIDSKLFSKKLK